MGERLARLHAGRCVVSAHNTFAGYEADLGEIARHLEENFEPFCGEVQTIEFSRVEKVGYTIVDTVELPNA